MVNTYYGLLLSVTLALTVTACGGGGGSSEPPPINTGASSSAATSSASSSSAAASSLDSLPPSATITFPNRSAKTDSNTVTVRGTASDDTAIRSIKVNGVEAVISAGSSVNTSGRQKQSTTLNTTDVIWEVTLELPYGESELEVTIEDEAGNITHGEQENLVLNNSRYPHVFLLDKTNNRFVGSAYDANFYSREEFFIELSTMTMTATNPFLVLDSPQINVAGTHIFSARISGDILEVQSTNLATGAKITEANLDIELDSSLWSWAMITDSTFAPDAGVYYFLVTYFPVTTPASPYSGNKSVIYQFNNNDKSISLLTKDDSTLKNANSVAYAETALLVNVSSYDLYSEAVIKVDLTTGDESLLINDLNILGMEIVVDDAYQNAYVAGFKDIIKIPLDNPEVISISPDNEQDLFNIAHINYMVMDSANQRLLIGDDAIKEVLTVDIVSGERGLLFHNGTGEGHKMIAPRQLALTSDNKFAFALDDGGNAPEALFKIDLQTGNRIEISNVASDYNDIANGLVLDEPNNRAFVAFGNRIGMVDLTTEEYVSVFEPSDPLAPAVGGMTYDAENDQLIVIDDVEGNIITIDADTFASSVLFDSSAGTGTTLRNAVDLVLDRENNRLLALSQFHGAVIEVDLANGNRTVIFDECIDNYGIDRFLTGEESASTQNFDFDPSQGKLLITGEFSVLEYDFATQSCRTIGGNVFDVLYLNDGTILGSYFNSLNQIDPVSGTVVTISK
jgi:hypothetical protein